jgi:hypothetical protein
MYADRRVKRADRSLIVVLAAAAVLAPILTGGATALFFLSRQQDDRLATLRSEIRDVRRTNGRLFGELASQTAAKNAAAARVSRLEGRVSGLERQLVATNDELDATRHALAWQKRAAEVWRQRALRRGASAARRAAARASGRSVVISAPDVRAAPGTTQASARSFAVSPPRFVSGTRARRHRARRLLDPAAISMAKGRGRGRGR